MKDFDEARAARISDPAERTFKLGGETFTIAPAVRPEALLPALDLNEAQGAEVFAIHDQLITAYLDAEGVERYTRLRQRDEDPITLEDQIDVIRWIQETATGRPTRQPGHSSESPGTSGTPLTVVPPSEESTQTG